MQTADPQPALKTAARKCFFTLPKTVIQRLCRNFKLCVLHPTLMAALEALIRFALPLITDDDLLSILQMRLFDQQQTDLERLLHNEGVLEDLEQLDKDVPL